MLHWADAVVMLAIVAAGCAASYLLVLRAVRHTVFEHQREIDRRLTSLTEVIALLETRLAGPEASTDALSAEEIEAQSSGVAAAPALLSEARPKPNPEEIPPEIQVAIAAAAIAVLGPDAHVRSAKAVRNAVSSWSQQGRVSVQSSHNLRVRR
jgi:hypothetical protein